MGGGKLTEEWEEMRMRLNGIILVIGTTIGIFLLVCSGAGGARHCVDHDAIVEIMERRLDAISEADERSYTELVYSSFDEVKEISFRHERSLYQLSRSVEERIGTEVFIELFQGHLLEWNGVTFINVFFRDEWKEPENIELIVDPRYKGVAVRFRQIVGPFLLKCINGNVLIDLDSQYKDPVGTARTLYQSATELIELFIQRLAEEDVRDVGGLRSVINERDWMVRIPE